MQTMKFMRQRNWPATLAGGYRRVPAFLLVEYGLPAFIVRRIGRTLHPGDLNGSDSLWG